MQQQEIEIQLWDYIDGTCNATGKAHIEQLIAADPQWQELYTRLLALHQVAERLEPGQPSMRFTKNVMDAIGQAVPVTRRYINPVIIRLIAGFFIVSIVLLLVYAFRQASFQSGGSTSGFDFLFDSKLFQLLAWVNMVACLLLFDQLLRRKRLQREEKPHA